MIFLFLLASTSLHSVDATSHFMPYGNASGDSILYTADDGFEEHNISVSFPFFGSSYDKLYVNTNGDITFETNFTIYTPSDFPIPSNGAPIIAPFWSDVDTREGGVIYHRETTTKDYLDQFTQEIRDAHCANFYFNASWLYVVTWEEVAFYGATGDGVNKRNTFQLVIGLDDGGEDAFAIFNYDRLDWTTGSASSGDKDTGIGGSPALVGFDAGDGVNHFKVPGSKTAAVLDLVDESNVGVPGKWIFKVSDTEVSGELNKEFLLF